MGRRHSRIGAVTSNWPAGGARILHSIGTWPAVINDETVVESCILGQVVCGGYRASIAGYPYCMVEPHPSRDEEWRMPSTSSRKASLRSAGAKACQEMRATENDAAQEVGGPSRRTDMRWLPPQCRRRQPGWDMAALTIVRRRHRSVGEDQFNEY